MLIETTATGGQAGQSSRIENYLGFPDGVSGGQLADRARRQAEKFGAELITARTATALEISGPKRTIRFADGGSIDAHAVIVATGASQLARRDVGHPLGGGMIAASFVGIFVIPPLYVLFQTAREKLRPAARPKDETHKPAAAVGSEGEAPAKR